MKPVNANVETFKKEVLEEKKLVLVDFWATWCGPCRGLAPKLEEIANEETDVKIVKVDVDENGELASQYGIRGIPTMLLFKEGKIVGELVGNHPKEFIVKEIKDKK